MKKIRKAQRFAQTHTSLCIIRQFVQNILCNIQLNHRYLLKIRITSKLSCLIILGPLYGQHPASGKKRETTTYKLKKLIKYCNNWFTCFAVINPRKFQVFNLLLLGKIIYSLMYEVPLPGCPCRRNHHFLRLRN